MSETVRFSIIGPGRVGQGLIEALRSDSTWQLVAVYGRGEDASAAGTNVDAVVITVPDDSIADVAAGIEPRDAVLLHMAGAKTLSVLSPHSRVGSVHPLASLPDPATAATRLRSGIAFAVDGDPLARRLVATLGGEAFHVPDELRVRYHATAAVAANHLVALCGQVERLAASVGIPADRYWDLMATSFDSVRAVGPGPALTGPAARGDQATVESHLADLPADERRLYRALAEEATRLATSQAADVGPENQVPERRRPDWGN